MIAFLIGVIVGVMIAYYKSEWVQSIEDWLKSLT